MQPIDNGRLLNRASALAENGSYDQARQLVMQAIKNDRKDVEAWWALSHVAKSDTERHQAVREVLRLDPHHLHAMHMRDQIRAGSLESIDHPGRLADRKYDTVDDDFQGKAIVTLFAYIIFSIVGFGLNLYFLYEANKFEKLYGYRPRNMGCLWALLVTFILVPLALAAFVITVAFIGAQTTAF